MTISSAARWTFHKLAQALRALHWGVGITTLPSNATPNQERSFVLMWLSLIIGMVLFFVVLFYLLR